jgi:hypothetical protein
LKFKVNYDEEKKKKFLIKKMKDFKNHLIEKKNALKSSFSEKKEAIKDSIIEKKDAIKSSIVETKDAIKTSIIEKKDAITNYMYERRNKKLAKRLANTIIINKTIEDFFNHPQVNFSPKELEKFYKEQLKIENDKSRRLSM